MVLQGRLDILNPFLEGDPDPSVLVHFELLQLILLPRVPDVPEDLLAPLSQLEAEEDAVLDEVTVEVFAGHHAGSEGLPPGVGLSTCNTTNFKGITI